MVVIQIIMLAFCFVKSCKPVIYKYRRLFGGSMYQKLLIMDTTAEII